jgi:hypothetical protein
MTPRDDDRLAYLQGEAVESLGAHERAELDELRGLLESRATWEEPDPSLEDRIVASIGEQRQSSPAHRRARWPRLRSSIALRRPAYGLAGAAGAAVAAVVIAAVVIVIALGNGGQAPQHFAMNLSGTELAPSAHGAATLTKTGSGWRVELSASGLPRRDNGLYYEAWLKNAAGVLVPVGTFNEPRHVTLWSGVPVTSYRTLTVTQQQANGNPVSSGKRVLLGTIRKQHLPTD